MNVNGMLAAVCACVCLLFGVIFTAGHQDEIRKENNAFARECNANGGQVRMEFNMRQCVGARKKDGV